MTSMNGYVICVAVTEEKAAPKFLVSAQTLTKFKVVHPAEREGKSNLDTQHTVYTFPTDAKSFQSAIIKGETVVLVPLSKIISFE